MDALFYVLGLVICGFGLLQMAVWTSASLANHKHNREQLEESRRLFRQQIVAAQQQHHQQQAGRQQRTGVECPTVAPDEPTLLYSLPLQKANFYLVDGDTGR